jgi:macrolide transport system ATP-binding/permease protein
MTGGKMNFALRIYRRLAQLFPHEFKLAYGADVIQLGEDSVPEIAARHGISGLIWLIADIAIRVPLEYLSEMQRDMRYALRSLRKSPGFAMVCIISMGLGIGLTTNVYSTKWAMVFRDLPAAANAKNLVMIEKPVSYYYVEQFREQKNLVAGASAIQTGVPFNVTFQGDLNAKPERAFGQIVSPDYFSVLGVQPQRGRVLDPSVDRSGDAPSVVITDRFWRNRLNSSPNAVGQILRLNGQLATIVGITPKNFNGAFDDPAANPTELFVPATVPSALAPELANDVLHQRSAKDFIAIICLAPHITIASVEAGLDAVTRNLDAQNPSAPPRTDNARRVTLIPAGTRLPVPRELKPVIAGFFIALMGLVMTLACANLANMLIARGANRRKELAIRLAIGASRFRLIRQMMAEGLVLSLLGGVAGFALASVLNVLNSRLLGPPVGAPIETDFTFDWHAAIFAFVLALICGIGFSLAPALQSTKADVTPALKEGSSAAIQLAGYRRFGLRNLLMVAQVAGSLMLLLITGFLVIGITKTGEIQSKFDANTMYVMSIDPVRDGYSSEKAQSFFEKLPEHIKSVGSVRNIALAAQPPFAIEDEDSAVQMIAENPTDSSRVQLPVIEETIGAGYFAALSEPILAGREFTERDERARSGESNTLPVVLNESAARGFFGNRNAIGERLKENQQSYEVIGVVGNLKNGIEIVQSIAYLPLTQRSFAMPPAGGISILIRSDAGPDALENIRNDIAAIDPNLTVFNVQTLGDYLNRSRSATRFRAKSYGGIGLFGLMLAAIGLGGVTAYAVAQRRKEIAIRTALGASKAQVLRLVLREGAALVTVGTVLGFIGTVVVAKLLSALTSIFVAALKIGTDDLRLLIGAPLLLAAVAMLACYLPARRATQMDPLIALREE